MSPTDASGLSEGISSVFTVDLAAAIGVVALIGVIAICALLAAIFSRRMRGPIIALGAVTCLLLFVAGGLLSIRAERMRHQQRVLQEQQFEVHAMLALEQAERQREASPSPSQESDSAILDPSTPRPAWVDNPMQPEDGAYEAVVQVGPFVTRVEANRELRRQLQITVDDYLDAQLGAGAARGVRLETLYILNHLLVDTWAERVEHAQFGPMINLHGRLRIDAAARAKLAERHRQAVVAERLSYAALLAVFGMGVLGTMFGYLKLDTFTKGYYTGRLRAAAAAVILTVTTLSGLVAIFVARS